MSPAEITPNPKPCKRAREHVEHAAHVWVPGGRLGSENAQCPGFLRESDTWASQKDTPVEHPGGCDHCVGPCGRADFGPVAVIEHRGAYNSVWYECPACAERKEIVGLLVEALDWLVDDQDGWLIDELTKYIAAQRERERKREGRMKPEDVIKMITGRL